jgi:hypothetical protein
LSLPQLAVGGRTFVTLYLEGRAIAYDEISDDKEPLPSPGGGGSAHVAHGAT